MVVQPSIVLNLPSVNSETVPSALKRIPALSPKYQLEASF